MIDSNHYAYRVMWSQEDGEYVALCSEFPSLSYLSSNHTKALKGITSLVAEIVADMLQDGEAPPAPISVKAFSGKLMLRIPPEQHRRLALEAAEQGISLNRHIACKLQLNAPMQ